MRTKELCVGLYVTSHFNLFEKCQYINHIYEAKEKNIGYELYCNGYHTKASFRVMDLTH